MWTGNYSTYFNSFFQDAVMAIGSIIAIDFRTGFLRATSSGYNSHIQDQIDTSMVNT